MIVKRGAVWQTVFKILDEQLEIDPVGIVGMADDIVIALGVLNPPSLAYTRKDIPLNSFEVMVSNHWGGTAQMVEADSLPAALRAALAIPMPVWLAEEPTLEEPS